MTAEALAALPDDGRRYALIAGELRTMTPAGDDHGRYAMRLSIPLGAHIFDHELGELYAAETGFQLAADPDTVQGADLAFVRAARVRPFGPKKSTYHDGPPDLAVEVRSPGDTRKQVDAKIEVWLAHGTLVVVVMEATRRRVEIHRPGGGPGQRDKQVLAEGETLTLPDLFPGWSLPVAALFAPRPARVTAASE
jgi:Uma2 family endonuclease